MPSPTCQVKDGGGAYQATTTGVDVTPGNTITINLVSSAGVSTWSIECVYTDELSSAATVTAALVIDQNAKTATYTAPVAGRAYIFRSRVNNGLDTNLQPQSSYTTTFIVHTLISSKRVLSAQETLEANATAGWLAKVNDFIRNPTTATDATTSAKGIVQLTNDLAGTAASPTVIGLTGTAGVLANDCTDVDSTANAQGDVFSRLRSVQTSSTTTTTLYAYTMADETCVTIDFVVTMARRTNVTKAGRYKGSATYRRTGGGAPALVGAAEYATDQETTAGDGVAIDVSSNDIRIRVTAADADNRNWFGEARVQVTVAT